MGLHICEWLCIWGLWFKFRASCLCTYVPTCWAISKTSTVCYWRSALMHHPRIQTQLYNVLYFVLYLSWKFRFKPPGQADLQGEKYLSSGPFVEQVCKPGYVQLWSPRKFISMFASLWGSWLRLCEQREQKPLSQNLSCGCFPELFHFPAPGFSLHHHQYSGPRGYINGGLWHFM